MAELLRMPEVAAGAEAALLSSWTVGEGADFSAKDVIAVIETDKAVVDFEAETAGRLVRQLVSDGTEVEVGSPIALLAAPGESIADVEATLHELGVGAGSEPSSQANESPAETAPTESAVASAAKPTRHFSSPLARRLAREAGIDITVVAGSGPGGRVVRRDVEAAIASGPAPAAQRPQATAAASAETVAGGVAAYTDIPHTRLRRAIAARLTESKATAPHFYVRGTARVDELLRMRAQINSGNDVRVSVNDLLIKAMAKAHRLVPRMNVVWMDEAVRQFENVDISVAISTDNGLVTPVVRSADRLSVSEIAAIVRDFAEQARSGRLQQHELEGGSTSISNLGMYGAEEFAAIINPPQASILAVGATRQAPVIEADTVVVGHVMTVTLSVDHRPVDGVIAAEWMRAYVELLENPARILA